MKNNKFSNVPTLVVNDVTVQDPLQQSNIFNDFFASKSSVMNSNDPPPIYNAKKVSHHYTHLQFLSVEFLENLFI